MNIRNTNGWNRKIDRRALLTSLGMFGVGMVGGNWLSKELELGDEGGDVVNAAAAAGSEAKLSWLNVKSFGAKGNNKTDDTAAFQKALKQAGGGVVYVPRGTYVISDTLQLKGNTSLIGDGKALSIIRMKARGKDGIRIIDANQAYVGHIQIRDVLNPGEAESHGFNVMSGKHVVLEHCQAFNCDNTGIRIGFDHRGVTEDCKVLFCEVSKVVEGSGIEVIRADGAVVLGCTVAECAQHGIRICGAKRATVSYNTLSYNNQSDISIQGFGDGQDVSHRAERFLVSHNQCKGGGQHAGIMLFNYANNGVVSENVVQNNVVGIEAYAPKQRGNYDVSFTNNVIMQCQTGIRVLGTQKRLYFKQNAIMDFGLNELAKNTAQLTGIDINGLGESLNHIFVEHNSITNAWSETVQIAVKVRELKGNAQIWIRHNQVALRKPLSAGWLQHLGNEGTIITRVGNEESNVMIPIENV
ncbi:right-handed parallel beta-helix repeat-containing protein [Paenibacillus sp. MER TA 81-3]|uniref:glycosyl hydrolase family 28-related protein n=1 Tax=Paenibacillus sp. MER TA 81-3 TaxID=2939573 RepID=UPI00203E68EF|nr:glycosyl hydrolase family 28-related protein [Paenibacillus sp. MER TA 81-3]MCM3338276.1 right-handed parallel beta-helix repeat-containing protein [Paenibacillus sp. MER TA 81-3]